MAVPAAWYWESLQGVNRELEGMLRQATPHAYVEMPMRLLSPADGLVSALDTLSIWASGTAIPLWSSPDRDRRQPARSVVALQEPPESSPRPSRRQQARGLPPPAEERPATGAEFVDPSWSMGAGELEIQNRTALDAAADLLSSRDRKIVRLVYVRAHESARLKSIAKGLYTLQVESGTGWSRGALAFTRTRTVFPEIGAFDYYEVLSSEGRSAPSFTVILRPKD